MSKTLQGHHTNKTRNTKDRLKRRQSVVAGRQQLYCAVQSRSSHHDCQTTTEKYSLQLATEAHSWQTMTGCSTHVPKPQKRHGRRASNVVIGTTSMAVSRAQTASSVDVICPEKAPSKQDTTALFHEDSGKPECITGMWLAPELATNGAHEAMGLCVLIASPRKPNGRRHSKRTATGLAVSGKYQREPSCSSPPCWHITSVCRADRRMDIQTRRLTLSRAVA